MRDLNIEYLKKHYDHYPYPLPLNHDTQNIYGELIYYSYPSWFWHKIWPEKPNEEKKINILIAGCGTMQAALYAKSNPNCSVIGVDLAKNSIEEHLKLKKKYFLKNLELFCDDFRNIKFNKKFDLIVCTGVLHHLKEPDFAMNFLSNLLEDDGVIDCMVYGDKINTHLNLFKDFFKKINLSQSPDSISFLKFFLNQLHQNHPLKIIMGKSNINEYDAEIIDTLLHESEKFFSIDEIILLLKKNNLIIKNFINNNCTSFSKFVCHDQKILDKINKLSIVEKWKIAQMLNWNDRKIQFFCTKKENIRHSLAYNPPSFTENYIHSRAKCFYEQKNGKLYFISERGETLHFYNVTSVQYLNEIFSGKVKISSITNALKDKEKKFIFWLINFLYEEHYIDVSFYPIYPILNKEFKIEFK